jgi:hypothetical protein
LQEDDNGQFTLVFQHQSLKRRLSNTPLAPLDPDDRQLLLKSTDTVMIEDLDEDSRLVQWREALNQVGVRSLLLMSLGQSR